MESKNAQIRLIANNKKAYHDYFIIEKYECGIELFGTEIKSIRMGRVSIKEAYVDIEGGEAYIDGMNISPYEKGNLFNRDPLRRKKLLLHKNEIRKLAAAVQQDGYTIVPLEVYLKKGRAKVEIGLAKGKHVYDKREDIRKRDLRRETERDYKDVMKV
ncbi:MAG TPA: SsrA-binding protein [Lachnospiraceae bacterium]|jgi:SsrA-binding protein|nr:SsrA-binding protein [Lachnospiraceae bacterium]